MIESLRGEVITPPTDVAQNAVPLRTVCILEFQALVSKKKEQETSINREAHRQ
jgi:hypothetical protein